LLIRCPGGPNDKSFFVGEQYVSEDCGFELIPGASLFIPIDDASAVYVACEDAGIKISWMII